MLQFLHRGRTINLAIDTRTLTGNVQTDVTNAYILSMKGGSLVAYGTNGLELADNNVAGYPPMGFLVNDMAGYFFENSPALGSGLAAVARGSENVIITDQIDTSLTFNVGDLLYASTSTKAGLLTNVAPSNVYNFVVGIALTSASLASPDLTVALSV